MRDRANPLIHGWNFTQEEIRDAINHMEEMSPQEMATEEFQRIGLLYLGGMIQGRIQELPEEDLPHANETVWQEVFLDEWEYFLHHPGELQFVWRVCGLLLLVIAESYWSQEFDPLELTPNPLAYKAFQQFPGLDEWLEEVEEKEQRLDEAREEGVGDLTAEDIQDQLGAMKEKDGEERESGEGSEP